MNDPGKHWVFIRRQRDLTLMLHRPTAIATQSGGVLRQRVDTDVFNLLRSKFCV